MGTTASAHKTAVKSISIDQNGWSRPCSASRGSSAASRRSLPMLSNLIGNKSPRNNGLTKADRIRLVDRAMKAEVAAADCETKMKGMEREIRTLELRNHDLSAEVCWLRRQCTIPCPDAPNGSVSSFVPPNCSEQCQVEKRKLQDTIASQSTELNRFRLDIERYASMDVRKDIRISELIKENDAAKARIAALEELCRDRIGGATLPLASSCLEHKVEIEVEDVAPDQMHGKRDTHQIFEDKCSTDGSARLVKGTAKSSNIRVLSSGPRPTLRHIFTSGKEPNIDGKARPSTAVDSSPSAPFVPPPLDRGDTVPILRSIEVLPGIPAKMQSEERANRESVEIANGTVDDPYYVKDVPEESDADSDIDISDILGNSHISMTTSQRSQSSKSRDSGFCRGDSVSTRSVTNNINNNNSNNNKSVA